MPHLYNPSMSTTSLVSFRFYREDTNSSSIDTLYQVLVSQLRTKSKRWKGKIIFAYNNIALIDIFASKITKEANICTNKKHSRMIANVKQTNSNEFLVTEMNGALHKFYSNTGNTTECTKSEDSSRPSIVAYNDFIILGLPINNETHVFNSAIEKTKTIPYGIEQFLITQNGNLLTFANLNKVIM